MTGRRLDRLPVAAGQFFVWRFLDAPGWTRGHPYSLSAAPTGDTLRITVKDLGDGSRGSRTCGPGTRVAIEGPYGRLHGGVRTRRKVPLLAGGIGVTPLRALLEELPQDPGDVTLVYRASHERDLVFRAELEALADARGARVFYAVGPRVADRHSWLPQEAARLSDEDALRQLVPDIADHDVYLCGADGWMDAAERALARGRGPRRRDPPRAVQLVTGHRYATHRHRRHGHDQRRWSCCSATTPAATRARSPSPPRLRQSGSGSSGSAGSSGLAPGSLRSSSAGAAPAPQAVQGATAAGTFTGDSVTTRWGPVQVEITVADGKITAVQAVEYPQDNARDRQINAYALPVLAQEVTQAQSAQIDAVSGATVTSDGYIQSLQSAIDQAHL